MNNQKIIIIGGGIGGLMTAIALNKKGIQTTIFEREKYFNPAGAGIALWSNATSVLDKLGLLIKLLPYSNVLNKIKISTSSGTPLNVVNIKKLEDKFHFPSIVLLRSDLQRELLNAIPSSQIQFNKQSVKIENKTNEIIIHFSDGTFEIADAVIFADGIHSIARKNIFKLPSLKYAGRTSWRGVAQFDKPFFSTDTSYEIFGKGKRIGIFPLRNNLAYWYAAVNMTEEKATKQKRTAECVLSHFKDWADPVSSLIKNTNEERLILTDINYTLDINSLANNNMVLLGDAAHPMTPDLGQGACQAIEDAYILAECLSENKDISNSFKSYENKRLKRVKSIAKNSFRMGKIRQIENPIALAIRNNLFRVLSKNFVLRMLTKNIGIKKGH